MLDFLIVVLFGAFAIFASIAFICSGIVIIKITKDLCEERKE